MLRLMNSMMPAFNEGRGMRSLVWSKKLSIGNVVIDSEHRNLMRMVNDAIRAIETRDNLALLQELEHLENWLCAHSANEEKIARAIDFPFARLKPAQQYSQSVLQHLRDEMEARYGMWSDSTAMHFAHFLKMWIIGHITAVDMPMRPLIQTHEYNFWPGWHDKSNPAAKEDCSPAPAIPSTGVCGCGCDSYSSAAG